MPINRLFILQSNIYSIILYTIYRSSSNMTDIQINKVFSEMYITKYLYLNLNLDCAIHNPYSLLHTYTHTYTHTYVHIYINL